MFTTKKQKILLELLLSNSDTFAICNSIVRSEYFDPELRPAVKFVSKYYEEHHSLPTPAMIEAEADVELTLYDVTRDQLAYCSSQIEEFCRYKAIEHAVKAAPAFIDKGDYGIVEDMIKKAVTVSLQKSLGLDYFADPQARLAEMAASMKLMSTGWTEVDKMLGGGIGRKELLLFAAGSGGGKSITLANLGLNFVRQGMNVLYLTLELAENRVAMRYDTMVSGASMVGWKYQQDKIVSAIAQIKDKYGQLTIKDMPGGCNANDIRAYLKEYELIKGHVPDLIIVDYLDLMNPIEKVSSDNTFGKDKLVSEQLREIARDYHLLVASASQLNRSAVKETAYDHSHIAGGISKINTSDNVIGIMLNEGLKAAGEICFQYLKTRNSDGVGKTSYLKWVNDWLLIADLDQSQHDPAVEKYKINTETGEIENMDDVVKAKKATPLFPSKSKKTLLAIMGEHE